MKILLVLLLFIHSHVALAKDEIWLQDTDCKLLASNGFAVRSRVGSLITHICNKSGASVTCSITSKNQTFNDKPSEINTYYEMIINEERIIWTASSYEGLIFLDVKNKRYSVTSTYIVADWLLNKNCVGEIKRY